MSDDLVFRPADALAAIEAGSERFSERLRRGTLLLEVYAPRGDDPQQPHDQDELYFVITGTGRFRRGEEVCDFEPGDALFVAAGVSHRFEDFSDDFAAWVVFYGEKGGELP